jgi:hypothetical protein
MSHPQFVIEKAVSLNHLIEFRSDRSGKSCTQCHPSGVLKFFHQQPGFKELLSHALIFVHMLDAIPQRANILSNPCTRGYTLKAQVIIFIFPVLATSSYLHCHLTCPTGGRKPNRHVEVNSIKSSYIFADVLGLSVCHV